jgi:2-polyprenyl-3-methyl-5-hydroxy-6-metoxy-1,4-benzoquinol methylase
MKLKYLLTTFRLMKIPGIFSIMKDYKTFVRIHFLYAALESGLLEALQAPCSKEVLLDRLKIKRPEVLDAILHVGLSIKELSYKNGLYSIKGKRSKSVLGEKGDVLAAVVQALATYYNASYRNASDLMHGASFLNDVGEFAPVIARFSKLVEPFIKDFIKDNVKGKASMRILEIGCGSGLLLKSALEANPNATGIGIDIDQKVVEQAKSNLSRWGIDDKFRIIVGDIADSKTSIEGPFDLITLYNVLYYFPVEERIRLFKKFRSLLSDDATVSIVNTMKSYNMDYSSANLNLANTTLKGITPLPDLDKTLVQLKESGLDPISTTNFMPGSSFYGIVAKAVSIE